MQNRTFLVLLRPIFGEKMKTAPLKEIGCRSCEVDVVIRPEKAFEFPILAEKSVSISVKIFFLFFFLAITCFWAEKAFESPKNQSQFRRRPFFLISPVLGLKKRLNFRLNWPKFRSQFYLIQEQFSHSFKKAPPPFFKPWLRACSFQSSNTKKCAVLWFANTKFRLIDYCTIIIITVGRK